jgi:phosphoglycolate/pyridoxal phosphate phosphatase family enzyme
LTIVFDLDGVVYRGETALPGAVAILNRLAAEGHLLFYLTNNATRSRSDYAGKLIRMGIPCEPEQVMTSAHATALYLKDHGGAGRRAFVVGEKGLVEELEWAGLTVVPLEAEERAEFVVAGLDKGFTYAKLARAYREIMAGAAFIATNRDPTYPLEEGVEIPGGGTMVVAIEYATGRVPRLIGKPEPYALERILALAGAQPADAVMVGDRTDTDIRVGRRVGLTTILTLTGVTSREAAAAAPPEEQPDYIIATLEELPPLLAALGGGAQRRSVC